MGAVKRTLTRCWETTRQKAPESGVPTGLPSYRIVVADVRSPRDGAYLEQIGRYDPKTDPPTVVLDEEKAREWLRKGAQPSEPVQRFLRSKGLIGKG